MSQKLQTLRAMCAKIMAHVLEQNACAKVVTRTELNEFLEVKKSDPRDHLLVSDALLNLVENGYLHRQFLSEEGIVNFWVTPKVSGAVSCKIELTPDNALLQAELRSPHPDLWREGYVAYTETTHVPVIESAAKTKPTWPWTPRPEYKSEQSEDTPAQEVEASSITQPPLDTSEFRALAAKSEAPIVGQTLVGSVVEEPTEEAPAEQAEVSNVVELRAAGTRVLRATDYAQILAEEAVRTGFGLTKFAGECEVEKFSRIVDSVIYANRARMRNEAIHSLIKQRGATWRVSELLTYMKTRLRMHLVIRSLEALAEDGRIVSYKHMGFTFLASTDAPTKKVANQMHSISGEPEQVQGINKVPQQDAETNQPVYINASTPHNPGNVTVGTPLEREGRSSTSTPRVPDSTVVVPDFLKRSQQDAGAEPEACPKEVAAQTGADPQRVLDLYTKLTSSDKGMILSLLLRMQP